MDPKQARELNHAAFRKLKPAIDRDYPPGRFVAIHEGQVFADADTFRELDAILTERGLGPEEVLVVQAGTDYPEWAVV
jgi:hypothetical protein